MPDEKKTGLYVKYIKPHLDIMMFFTIVGMGITVYLTYEKDKLEASSAKKEIEQRIYPDALTLQKAMEHDNEVPSDVENFKREIRLIKAGDTLVEFQKIQLEAQKEIEENIKVIDSFYQFAKAKAYNDSIASIKKQISRDQRTQDVEEIKRENRNIGNTLQAIQRKLDSIN